MMVRRLHYFPLVFAQAILVLLFLSACSGNGTKWNPNDYTVKSGDTIYSIAWRYEVDPEQFAAWNGVNSSYFIKPGQRLHTRKPANFDTTRKAGRERVSESVGGRVTSGSIAYVPQVVAKPVPVATHHHPDKKWVKAGKGDSLYGLSKRYGVSVKELARLNQLKKPYIIQPGQTIYLKPLKPPTQTVRVVTPPPAGNRTARKQVTKNTGKPQRAGTKKFSWPKTIKWRRPAKGKLVKKFSRQRNDAKGIDIAGKPGDSIIASAAGKVVYSGDGLISYGKLIIIKHNRTYLSAYAYNRKLLVKEGDIVSAGQKIAEMGRKDKSSTRLHFEIRKNGKPVDPLKYLPW